MNIGYKVLDDRESKGKFSIIIRYDGGIQYNINAMNIPKPGWGPFCVLPTMKLAEDFVKMYGDMTIGRVEIWELEYELSSANTVWQKFLNDNIDVTEQHDLFSNTVLADKIWFKTLKYRSAIK